MEGVTERLANFATRTKFSDLPQGFIDIVKRILLDSIG